MNRRKVLEAVYLAVERLNEQLVAEERIQKSAEAKLFGPEGPLDSLGLVNLVVLVEEAVHERLGQRIVLGEEAVTEGETAFSDVDSLVRHLCDRLDDRGEEPLKSS